MPWGIIGGAAIGAAGSFFSGKSAARASERNYKHRYQWMMKDLEKAGLNPMLAIGQGPGSGPDQPNIPDIGEGALRGVSAAQAVKLQKEQTQLARESANKNAAEAESIGLQNTIVKGSEQYRAAEQAALQFNEGGPGVSAYDKVRAQQALDKTASEISKLDLEGKTLTQALKLNTELAPLLVEAQKLANKIQAQGATEAQIMEKMYSEYPTLRKIKGLREVIFGTASPIAPYSPNYRR